MNPGQSAFALLLSIAWFSAAAAPAPTGPTPGDHALDEYFRTETARLETNAFAGITTQADWDARRPGLRQDLFEMLGLWPLPARSDLQATITGQLERDDLVVEKLHFQSLPGLYVTANLYRPRQITGRLPTILYACGHAPVKTNGVSCGNKVAYQHHGIWFARHGYVCLLIDTLQLGEIEGVHHGTYQMGQWWWNGRGYTPAGVEAWNCIRALDYLESRPDVDTARIGMTGRSGGGSYTWTTAALDDRIRVAAPVAGITDLRNQVIDGVVEGHCDCMFFLNSHRWDFGLNAALLAPRPLLIVNSDADKIFPLDGVQRVHAQVRRIYQLYNASTNLGLVIAPGPHKDTQDLQVPVFRWFNRHLQNADPLIEDAAVRLFSPLDLRVFDSLPTDQRNTTAQEWFGPVLSPPQETSLEPETVLSALRQRVFVGWPHDTPVSKPSRLGEQRHDRRRLGAWEFESQPGVRLPLFLVNHGPTARPWIVRVVDDAGWKDWNDLLSSDETGALNLDLKPATSLALLVPRGIGPTAWSGDEKKKVQIRRRFMLLGQTLDGMRVWDIRRGLQVLGTTGPRDRPVELEADGPMAVNAIFAALHEPNVKTVRVRNLPVSLRDGPDYLHVLEVLDLPQAIDMLRRRGTEVIVE